MPRKKEPSKEELTKLLEDVKAKGPKAIGLWKAAHGPDIDILTPEEFYSQLSKPTESPAHKFFKDLQEGKAEVSEGSTVVEYHTKSNAWRFRKVKSTDDFKKLVEQSKGADDKIASMREARVRNFLSKQNKTREDAFGGPGFDQDTTFGPGNMSGYEIKHEYTPLLGTPFFKQMYLYDYLLSHAKSFWYKNYSGPAKIAMQIYRGFVIGEGFSVTIEDQKAQKAWEEYEKRSKIHEKLPVWHDEAFFAGELMLEKKFTPAGLVHESIDPSTIWEIVTDPENISDIKYYHQQYPTQYQIYGDKDTPITKYIIRQIPPELIHHLKFNVTSWEKRGRSDMLASLLYLKYFDDYISFKLQRTKAEAAYFWDVAIEGDASDVAAYIASTQSVVDVPPGSENVHNKAVQRTPIAPSLSHTGADETAKWILSYVAMSYVLPAQYWGTFEQQGASRASALVSTEPTTKMMQERRLKVEALLHEIFKDVMIDAGLDPETKIEFNFPELVVEDRSKKLGDVFLAQQNGVISHETAANIVAKELNITTYDYEEEQDKIKDEVAQKVIDLIQGNDLTPPGQAGENSGHNFDRASARDDNSGSL